jgi:hypothetical protein
MFISNQLFLCLEVMNCAYCDKKFLGTAGNNVSHVNISQSTQKHVFCTKKCKDKWLSEVRQRKVKKLIFWAVGIYLGRYYFVKKITTIKGFSSPVMLEKKSYFTKNLCRVEELHY